MLMCAVVRVRFVTGYAETERNGNVCCILGYGLLRGGGWGGRREMLMCAGISFKVPYGGEGNGDVSCR